MEAARPRHRRRKARRIAMAGHHEDLGSPTRPVAGAAGSLGRAMVGKRSRDSIGQIEGVQSGGLADCRQENSNSKFERWVSVEKVGTGCGRADGCWVVESIGCRRKSARESSEFCSLEQPQMCSASQTAKRDVASEEVGDFLRPESSAVVQVGTRTDSLLESDREFSSAARVDEEKINSGSLPEEAKRDIVSVQSFGEPIPGSCEALMTIADNLVAGLAGLKFASPVTCVYNPLVYARELYEQYVMKHGGRRVEVLLIGMNPGPFGMAQTGVPFGDSKLVREFHGITGKVGYPDHLHLKRPIYGLQCPRQEVSGQRLWGWARDSFGSASNFFKHFWVCNYCPLVFMEASGKNRTPDKLQPVERSIVKAVCGKALIQTISLLQPQFAVGIGSYAADRIWECGVPGVKIGKIMHPSPANPKANKNWAKIIESQLQNLGVDMLDRNT